MAKNIRKLLTLLMAAALILGTVPAAYAAAPEPTVTFTFTDEGVTAAGGEDGYKIEGTSLTVNKAGTYLVTGSCSEGSISVKKDATGVTLILKDLTLASSVTAPLTVKKNADAEVYIQGTDTLTDKEDIADEDSDDFEGAAVKVKSGSNLTLTGDGVLNADGSACKNGIKGAAESLVCVTGGVTVNITAANNGLAADGAVKIMGGTVNIDAAGDGIKSEPEDDDTASAGTVTIEGGSITVKAGDDGIQSTGLLEISGCTLDINAGDDAIHGDSDVNVKSGTITVSAADDAIHSEYLLTIGEENGDGPDITVTTCCEGFEGAAVQLISGKGSLYCTDDGINAANGDLTDYSYYIIAPPINS